MNETVKNVGLFGLVACLIVGTGFVQGANAALVIVNFGLISAIMALGVNLQWGFAGLFNIGVMGFVALGGLAAVLIGMPPTTEAIAAGGGRMLIAMVVGVATIIGAVMVYCRMAPGRTRTVALIALLIIGFLCYRALFDPARDAIEAVNPAGTGYLGGLGIDGIWMVIAWPVGGMLAAGAAWVIGKTALGLRSDYLAIATLGIAEIIIAVLKNEDWLSRGVKNVVGVPRPTSYEVDLQADPAFVERAAGFGLDPVLGSTIYVKLQYSVLFTIVLAIVLILAQLALASPWGRMMRAIRDNEVAAEAMGKDVTARHLQIFILGSAICGMAGAMMTTLDSQLTPAAYQPLRFTFLIWVMVIVGGSGNNFGAVLGGFLIWFLWIQVEPASAYLLAAITAPLADGSALKDHLLDGAAHMRLITMGLVLLLVLRFAPRGLIPER
ncbi:branched-chain amino acid ABC transporter permease [Shimia ponticola]|uniref:branched-chain amino acid ABC transporter permease n=1 Tax=Shimia ponticola TaxID=2582893 RepID=UPI0011BEC5E5|nr:branched-chain amino acid ABC transporter permease [Shimia ponticola]